jgi:hypothetical protein
MRGTVRKVNVRVTRPHFVWKEWGWAQQRVVFRTPEGKYVDYEPKTLEEFVLLGVGAERELRVVKGEVELSE